MLSHRSDLRTILYMMGATALLILQWTLPGFHWPLFLFSLFMGISVAVIAHNHNHLPIWKSKFLNGATDYWITLFYGYPVFGWIPTHNANHHSLNNRAGDYTITYRMSEANTLATLLTYPTISGAVQSGVNWRYLKDLRTKRPAKFFFFASQILVLFVFLAAAFFLNWKKALLYIFIPQQVALTVVLYFNYIQHVHCDEESKWNHSRNFVGPLINALLFNNGYHTVHHMSARRHWSEAKSAHEKIKSEIAPHLLEKSFWWYMIRVYLLGVFFTRFRTKSLRLERMAMSPATR